MGTVSKLCLLSNDINAIIPDGLHGLLLFPGQWSRDYRQVGGGLRQKINLVESSSEKSNLPHNLS